MKIHYIQPFSVEKNIGGAINNAIAEIMSVQLAQEHDSWIVLTDHDMLWLLPDSKTQVEAILHETDYDILGCMTNRIRSKEQLYGGVFSEDDRIREHIRIAQVCRDNAGNLVKPANGPVAAFMMCFKYTIWHNVNNFVENVINFDKQFCDEARRICNAKVGIMQGVYVWHSYRLWSKNARQDHSHLLNK